jgi:hypothetical protein
MEKVTVCFFTKYVIATDRNERSKRPATLETIERVGGSALIDTAQEVDASHLDEDGFLK